MLFSSTFLAKKQLRLIIECGFYWHSYFVIAAAAYNWVRLLLALIFHNSHNNKHWDMPHSTDQHGVKHWSLCTYTIVWNHLLIQHLRGGWGIMGANLGEGVKNVTASFRVTNKYSISTSVIYHQLFLVNNSIFGLAKCNQQ